MILPFVSDHFRYLSDSVRQDVAKLHDEESSKMEENHKDHWNSASSQGLKYFNKEILQGFLPSWHFLVYVLLGCDGLMGIGCNTFSKLQFQIWSTFACVMELYDMAVIKALLNAWSCTIWLSLKPRWMPGAVWYGCHYSLAEFLELYVMAVITASLNAWSYTIWVSLQPRWMPGAVCYGCH